MIQRIQTIYLFLAAATNGALFLTPLWVRANEDPSLWVKSAFGAGLILAACVSLFAIFRFADRTNQIVWVKRAMLFETLAVGSALGLIVTLGGFGAFMLPELASFALVLLPFLFQILAIRGIQHDEDLVRSMDRLR